MTTFPDVDDVCPPWRFVHKLHPWCQPGDRPNRVWMLIFDDPDRRPMLWTHEDAESSARDAWNRFAPAWNCTLLCSAEQEKPS
jgi:hypothetical protein